jgi:HEAT repeat protein
MTLRIVGIAILLLSACPAADTDEQILEQLFRRAIKEQGNAVGTGQSRQAVQQLKDWGPAALPFLCRKLEHPCLPGIYTIQEVITSWSSNAVTGLLRQHTLSTNEQARRIMVYYLGLIRDPRGRSAAEQELDSSRNRSTALWTLGCCGITDAVPWAAAIITTSAQEMARVRSAGIVRKLGDTQQCSVLVRTLAQDSAWNVRCAAAHALAAQGPAGCIALTGAWDTLSPSGKILGMSVIAETTNFTSEEVLKFYTYDTDHYVAAHAVRLLRGKEVAVTNTHGIPAWLVGEE